MSPLRKYSDVEWISHKGKFWKAELDVKDMRNILEAIPRSEAGIEALDFWRDDISVPLDIFNLGEPFEDLYSELFSRLRTITVKVPKSSLEDSSAACSVRRLLAMATKLGKLYLCIDGPLESSDNEKREDLRLLIDGPTLARMRESGLTRRPNARGSLWTRFEYDYDPPWRGSARKMPKPRTTEVML